MRPSQNRLALLGFLLVLVVVAVFSYVQIHLASSISNETALAANIGKILQLDEVLTMSAKMAASSQRDSYRERYFRNVDILDQTITSTLRLVESDSAKAAISSTQSANDVLVAMEMESFELGKQGKYQDAVVLLDSPEYQRQKEIYTRGMSEAFLHLREAASSNTKLWQTSVLVALLFVILCLFLLGYLWMKLSAEQRIEETQRARIETLRITMNTVTDVVNNTLNNLLLFKLKAEESSDFSVEETEEFDQIIQQASNKLREIGELRELRIDHQSAKSFQTLELSRRDEREH